MAPGIEVKPPRIRTGRAFRAISDRARYRDFYDLTAIFDNFRINLEEIIKLVKRKEIRNPITKKSMLENWEIARQDKQNELANICCFKELNDESIEKMIKKISIK